MKIDLHDDRPQPGQGVLCRVCRHYLAGLANQGHPSPCRRMAWSGPKHVSPVMSRTSDGQRCDQYLVSSEKGPRS